MNVAVYSVHPSPRPHATKCVEISPNMYYSRPFHAQERGARGSNQGSQGKDGTTNAEGESISGMLTNFSKALGKSSVLAYFSFKAWISQEVSHDTIQTINL